MARNMKSKRFDDGGEVDPVMEDESDRGAMTPEQQANSDAMKPKTAAPRVVSKAELEKSGLSLRDFLNRERGLTRRGGPSAPAKVTDTGSDVARMLARAPKPALRQETFAEREKAKFDEGQRIMAAKRAAAAEADAANDRNRQARILTGIRKNAGANLGMGSTGLKSGGSVSKASGRADGIAQRGKTRGKMC
jgi:hypothetical protein